MTAIHTAVIWNLGLMVLVGLALWWTKNPWCLLGLIFGMTWKHRRIDETGEDEE